MKSILEMLEEEKKYVNKLNLLRDNASLMVRAGIYDSAINFDNEANHMEDRVIKIREEIFAALKGK